MSGQRNSTTPMEAIFGNNEFELDKRITFSYGAIGLLALLSNMALCAVLLRNRQMLQRAYNIIIFALAIVDTLTGMTIIVATVLVQVCGSKPGKSKAVGLEMLEIVQKGWFEFLFGEFSLFFIMVLTIERWFAVVRPIQYRYKFSKKRIYIYIFTIVIATLSINIHVLLPSYNPYSTRSKSIVVMDFVVTLVTPLLVTWTTYIHLWQRFKKVPTIQQSNNTKMKQRLVRMCAITAMFITACWIPTEIYYLVTTFGLTSEDWRISKSVDTVAMSNSLVNPWIYYFTNKEYKKEFTKLFNDIVFPIQDMVICCPSDSLTVTNVESSDTNSKEIAGTVIPLTNLTLQNE